MRDIIIEIWSTARRNKLRTALTGFAVAWGIFMLIFLLGAGNGLINAQLANSDRFMDNSMMIFGGQTSKAYNGFKEGRKITLREKDLNSTRHDFRANVDEVGAQLQQSGVTISLGENYVSSSLDGVYPNEDEINKIEMLCGRFVNQEDLRQTRKVVVISEDQAKQLYPKDISSLIGQYVKIGDIAFCVVGIYKSDQSQMNSDAYSAFSTVRTMYNKGDEAGNIEFSFHGLKTQADNDALRNNIVRASIKTIMLRPTMRTLYGYGTASRRRCR
jgi:putative ABC transport system permease protein